MRDSYLVTLGMTIHTTLYAILSGLGVVQLSTSQHVVLATFYAAVTIVLVITSQRSRNGRNSA